MPYSGSSIVPLSTAGSTTLWKDLAKLSFICISVVLVGSAFVDIFSVRCTGWRNCRDVDNDRLSYNYYIAWLNQTAVLPQYIGPNSSVNLFFPVGDETDHYRNQLIVGVTNEANYSVSLPTPIYPVTVSQLVYYCQWGWSHSHVTDAK